jgi:hypothetical protein
MSDIEGKAARVAASEAGAERVSNRHEFGFDNGRLFVCPQTILIGE